MCWIGRKGLYYQHNPTKYSEASKYRHSGRRKTGATNTGQDMTFQINKTGYNTKLKQLKIRAGKAHGYKIGNNWKKTEVKEKLMSGPCYIQFLIRFVYDILSIATNLQ